MITNFINWFKSFSQPKLKSSYSIFCGDEILAILSDPEILDQFWVSFVLSPQTKELSKLEELYSVEFWHGSSIVIRETDTGRRVQFMRAMSFEDDEIEIKDDRQERPSRLSLRGPYKLEG